MSPYPRNRKEWRRLQEMQRFSQTYGRLYPPPGDPSVPPPPDRAGSAEGTYIVGFRLWRPMRNADGRLRLRSTFVKVPWEPGANKAVHRPGGTSTRAMFREDKYGPHDAPAPGCSCGLYAMHTPELAEPRTIGLLAKDLEDDFVLGAVLAWGEIEVHASGFRAEYAMPLMLARPPGPGVETVEKLALYYSIPIVERDELLERALEHGEPVPDRVRPSTAHLLEHEIVTMHAQAMRHWTSPYRTVADARRRAGREKIRIAAGASWAATSALGGLALVAPAGVMSVAASLGLGFAGFIAGFSTLYLSRL